MIHVFRTVTLFYCFALCIHYTSSTSVTAARCKQRESKFPGPSGVGLSAETKSRAAQVLAPNLNRPEPCHLCNWN
jgi:hypothetical protein